MFKTNDEGGRAGKRASERASNAVSQSVARGRRRAMVPDSTAQVTQDAPERTPSYGTTSCTACHGCYRVVGWADLRVKQNVFSFARLSLDLLTIHLS